MPFLVQVDHSQSIASFRYNNQHHVYTNQDIDSDLQTQLANAVIEARETVAQDINSGYLLVKQKQNKLAVVGHVDNITQTALAGNHEIILEPKATTRLRDLQTPFKFTLLKNFYLLAFVASLAANSFPKAQSQYSAFGLGTTALGTAISWLFQQQANRSTRFDSWQEMHQFTPELNGGLALETIPFMLFAGVAGTHSNNLFLAMGAMMLIGAPLLNQRLHYTQLEQQKATVVAQRPELMAQARQQFNQARQVAQQAHGELIIAEAALPEPVLAPQSLFQVHNLRYVRRSDHGCRTTTTCIHTPLR